MRLDRGLVDAIKTRFGLKSSAQLREIAQATNQESWSLKAIAAADEVLQERLAGRAKEPLVAEPELAPPEYHYEPGQVALGVLGGLLSGYLAIPYYRRVSAPDVPLPFDPRVAWLALDTCDTDAVARALDLHDVQPATWSKGVEAAYQSSVFVTPPVGDWTLAVSTALFPRGSLPELVKPLLERLSQQFAEAQYFCTQRDIELHAWARARRGRLVRGYGWLGQSNLTLWDQGTQTEAERELGFDFKNQQSQPSEQSETPSLIRPDESAVMQLASIWSVDPTTLDEQFGEPLMGLLGER